MKHLQILIFILFTNLILFCQENRISVSQIEEAYNNINFDRVINLSSRALENHDLYSADELIDLYKIRGFTFFHIGNESEAKSSFQSALTINPELKLDEITVSPKIIDFFNNLKKRTATDMNKKQEPGFTKYVLVDDPRPAAALRSAILPGWGQYYKEEEEKAYIVFSAFAANSIALVYSLIQENSTRDEYIKANSSSQIESKYKSYNSWFKARQFLTYSEILIWSFAFADALWSPVNKDQILTFHISSNLFSVTFAF